MNCSQCGVEVQANSRFCQKCGERLDMPDASGVDQQDSSEPEAGEPSVEKSPAERAIERLTGGRSENTAADDETMWTGTFSPKAMIGIWIGIALVVVVLFIIAYLFSGTWWKVFFIATPIICLGGYLKLLINQWSVRYTLSNKRFTHEHGLLRRVTDRIEVIDMDDIRVTQTLIDRFTGTGTIKIISSDRSHPELLLKGIDGALVVGAQLDDARRAERERRGLYIEAI